jgi:pimeloyl-ACP methyl ester carboxylesterase
MATYDIVDLVDDALGILKSYHIDKAHFFGMSLGGLIAQIAALKYPEKVRSLTLFATGPWGESDPDIPAMDARIIDIHLKASSVDWTNEKNVVAYLLEVSKLMSAQNFDADSATKLFTNEFKRANNYRSMFNHSTLGGGEEYFGKTATLNTKCLIIHGDQDIIWNYRHALFLHKSLKNSNLVILQGTGHELNPKDWDVIIEAFYQNGPAHSLN